jgi:hypothetical protein
MHAAHNYASEMSSFKDIPLGKPDMKAHMGISLSGLINTPWRDILF